MGYKKSHTQLIGRMWHYYRRVPKCFSDVDPRRFVKQALRTDSEIVAERRAAVVNEATEQYWRDLISNRSDNAKERYAAAIRIAQGLGVSYMPADELAQAPLHDIADRLTKVRGLDPGKISEANANALLGGVDKPNLTLSDALEEYWTLAEHVIRGKTEREIKKWRNPHKLAVSNFIKVVGDKPISEISRNNTLDFRAWWLERLNDEDLTAYAPNKNFQKLSNIFNTVNDDLRLGLENPFSGLRFSEKNEGGTRDPFPDDDLKNVLDLGRLEAAGLNLECQMIILACADTGCGVGEITGLDPDLDEIFLDGDVPYIHIKPNKHRNLKTKHRPRTMPLVGNALYAFRKFPNGFPSYRGKADSASSWINRMLREAKLTPRDELSLYSLRHNFEDRLTAAEAPDKVAASLMGHSYHRPVYGLGPHLKLQHKWLKMIALPAPK